MIGGHRTEQCIVKRTIRPPKGSSMGPLRWHVGVWLSDSRECGCMLICLRKWFLELQCRWLIDYPPPNPPSVLLGRGIGVFFHNSSEHVSSRAKSIRCCAQSSVPRTRSWESASWSTCTSAMAATPRSFKSSWIWRPLWIHSVSYVFPEVILKAPFRFYCYFMIRRICYLNVHYNFDEAS